MSENATGAAALTAAPAAPVEAPTGAPPVEGQPSGSPPAAAPQPGKWWGEFKDETVRGYAETKNFTSPEEAVRSYQNLEKLLGSKASAITLPTSESKPEEWASLYDKLGRPGSADNYAVPEPLKDDATVKGFAGKAHELGLSSKQWEGVMQFVGEQSQSSSAAREAEAAKASAADMEALRKDNPGVKYDALIEHGRRAITTLGLDTATLTKIENAMGTRPMMEMFGKIGASNGETPFITGQSAQGDPTPEGARVQIASLQKDSNWVKKWMAGDTEAVALYNKLNVLAAKK